MERTAVQSRDIAIIGYDKTQTVLEIAFRSGSVYHYQKVPLATYQAFISAPSYGIYFRDHIRDQFPSLKIS